MGNSVKVVSPSTNLKKLNVLSSKNVTNFKLLLKKLKLLLRLRNPNVSDLRLKWFKTSKILNAVVLRKKKRLTTPDVMDNVLWNPCKPHLILNLNHVLKPFAKRSLKVTLTISKFNSVMPTDLLLKHKNNLRLFK